MPNALVEQFRRARPAQAQGKSDAELTQYLARTFEARGDLAQYRQRFPDFNRDLLDVTNSGGDIGAETSAALKAGVFDRLPGAVQSVGALVADMVAREELAALVGLDQPAAAAGDALRGMAEENKREAAQRIADAGGRTIARIEDIRPTNPRDYALWALPAIAENAPSLAVSLGAGAGAGLLTRNPAIALAAAGAAGVGQNVGEIYGDLQQPGVDRNKAITAALVGGTVAGLLDVIPQVAPLSKLFPGLSRGAVGELVQAVMGKGGWSGAARGAFTQALGEGVTEGLQEAVNIAAEEYATGKSIDPEEVRSRILNAAATGGVIGGPVGAVTGALPDPASPAAEPPPQTSTPPAAPVAPDPTPTLEEPQPPANETPIPQQPPVEVTATPPVATAQAAVEPPPAVTSVSPAPMSAAGEFESRIAYLDEQLAAKEITAEEHAALTSEARAKFAPPAAPTTPPAPTPLLVSDFEPSRIAKTTSNDLEGDEGRGGWYAVAIEKDGKVEVRNIYERKDGARIVENSADLLPNVRTKGTGRNIETFLKNGWTVRAKPFRLAGAQPHLKLSLAPGEFDAQFTAARARQDDILSAINDGRGDRLVEAGLKSTDPDGWRAVEFLRDRMAAETGHSPSHIQIALSTRVDSTAERDTLRANATAKKLASGDLLRKKNGKVFGVFTDEQWADFKRAVASPIPPDATKHPADAAIDDLFKNAKFKEWAMAMGELGSSEQARTPTGRTTVSADETPNLADDVATLNQLAAEGDFDPFTSEEFGALEAEGFTFGELAPLLAQRDLTAEYVAQRLMAAPEFAAFRARLKKQGPSPRRVRSIIDNIVSLHELGSRQAGLPADGRGDAGAVRRGAEAPADATATLRSQPAESLADAEYRASPGQVARAWSEVVAFLRDAGIDVRAVQAAVDDTDAFYRATGGRTDARRFIELVLKDITAPSGTDLEVATHEAVHVLFATAPEALRKAIHRAIARLPDPDPEINASLRNPDPEVRAQEKLAVLLQREGVGAGAATNLSNRILRFLKELYYRSARVIALLLGHRAQADALALQHFKNRLSALLNGDFAPQSISNALGGRPLTWSERAAMLPGFGRSIGRVINGHMVWAPKVPDTAEALAFNLDLAFSRPPENESEANVRRGVDAVNKILRDRTQVVRGAMYRAEVGSITFEWGEPGDHTKEFRRGFGLSHILARRALVQGMPPVEVLSNLIETIAYGDASAPYGGEGDTRVRIDDGKNAVILSLARFGKRETWVVSSFDNTRAQNNASATDAKGKTVPSPKATQAARAFSPSDLDTVADGLTLGTRMRVVNSGLLYSRPGAGAAAVGAVDNPANAINRDIATINHAIGIEQQVRVALAANGALNRIANAALNGGLDIAAWFRTQFQFENPEALKAQALQRLDPQTQQPVQGVNPSQTFGDFDSETNSASARIHAYMAARKRMKALSAAITAGKDDITRAQNRRTRSQQNFVAAHRDYLNAEGLTSIVLRGVRQLIARERKLGLRTGKQVGIVMQQLRELDARSEETIDREYAGVFKKLFRGDELRGRSLFDLLDQMVNEANIDFRGLKITEIRQKIAERVGAGMGSPELGLLINATPSSRALLATVVAYGKAHPDVLAQIERRRLKNIAERLRLQDELEKLLAERSITNQAIKDLPRTAKLEERARILYRQAKRRDDAMADEIRTLEEKVAAAESALPLYQAAVEDLARQLGGLRPDYTFGDGMKYRVPVNGSLVQKTLRISSTGQITDRAQLDRDLAAMTEWLGMKEAAGELDADYRDLWAARQALLEGGYFESDVRKTDTWVRGNVFLPVGARAAATGLPTGRIIEQMFNRFASVENELKAAAQRMGDRNNRLRDEAIGVLNRGRPNADMTADRYYSEIAEPAMSIAEKARDLLELGLSPEQIETRIFQRVVNRLLENPATEPFVRGKEAAVVAALKSHLRSLAESSKWLNDVNARYGLGVRDERVIVDRGDGIETAGIRESLPVGPMTFSRKASALVSRVYRTMLGQGWGGFAAAIKDAAAAYTRSPDDLRQLLAPFFSDPAIVDGFVGAMAETDTYSSFDTPVLPDGVTRGEADPTRVAAAWRQAGGDIVAFIELMYDAHGGTTDRAQYAAEVLGRMAEYFSHLGEMLPGDEVGMTPNGLSNLTSNLMIDARTLDRWPTRWTEYQFFDPHSNHALARRVASQVAFGRDTKVKMADGSQRTSNRLAEVWATLEKEMDAAYAAHDSIIRRELRLGFSGRELAKRVEADYVSRLGATAGKAEYRRIERLVKLRPVIAESKDSIRAFFSSKHNQLDAVRFASQLGQAMAFGMLNNPGTALVNLADLFAPVIQSGVSATTLKQVANNWRFLGEGVAGSVAQALGLDILKSSRLQNLYVEMQLNDPAVALRYIAGTEDGIRSDITSDQAARGFNESAVTKALRLYQRAVSFGVTPLGEASRFTALRPLAPFQQFVLETMRASTLSTWQRAEDMVLSGLRFFDANPAAAADPNFRLTGEVLGLAGAELAAFETMRTRMAEAHGLELTALVREAMARQAGPRARNELLSRTTRALLQGMAANELILEGNIATMTPKAWTSSFARLVLPLWGWPIRRAMQVARLPFDSKDQFRLAVLGRGVLALGVMAGAGLAMSLLADEYHEHIVGRKRNLRSVTSIPGALERGQFGEVFLAMMENVNRAGTFGLWGEVLNTGINGLSGGGDNRTISFDQRVVMMNSMLQVSRALSSLAAQRDIDYSSVVRPVAMSMGGNSALQYLQIGNNWLGLDNSEARFVERVDTQNRLRVAGRELGLEVRTGSAMSSVPTPVSPHVARMVLAAYAGDRTTFLAEWRKAVSEARELPAGAKDPVGYVRDSFAGRHPLKAVFRSIGEDQYVRLLRHLDDDGRREVREAVNRFNAYAESLDARAFVGTKPRDAKPRL